MIEPISFGRPADAAPPAPHTGAVSQDVLVTGMTCGHCVRSVVEELSELSGVSNVAVDLKAGGTSRVTIHSAAPVDSAAVVAAIADAGYEVVSA